MGHDILLKKRSWRKGPSGFEAIIGPINLECGQSKPPVAGTAQARYPVRVSNGGIALAIGVPVDA